MIVDHFNTLLDGGAASAARRIHRSLRGLGVTSRFWNAKRDEPQDDSCQRIDWAPGDRDAVRRVMDRCMELGRKLQQKRDLRRHLAGHPPELEFFSVPLAPRSTRFDVRGRRTDIVHLHWTAKLIDYPSFFGAIPDDFPMVWTLHDMAPFTGGCHYSVGCQAYVQECRCCPLLGRRGEEDLSNRSFHIKKAALAGKNLHIVGPSRWLETEARRSAIFSEARSFRTIPYGIDTDIFSPIDRREARRALGIHHDATIVAFGAVDLHNRRKGLSYLLEALSTLADQSRVLGLVFGGGDIPKNDMPLPAMWPVGYISDPRRQAMVYSAADLFVLPSLEEGFGLTGLESLACGTPVVGFAAGGIPDFVLPGETGLLARVGNAADLAAKIRQLVESPAEARRMGRRGRELAVERFAHRRQAEQYLALYEELTSASIPAAMAG